MQAAVCSRFPPSLTCPLRAERPRSHFLAFLGYSSPPPPQPPHSLIPSTARLRINYISIDWPLIRGIDIHGPPSAGRGPMCIPQHKGPGLMHHTGITLFIVFVVASSPFGEKREWNQKKRKRKKLWLGARCLSRR